MKLNFWPIFVSSVWKKILGKRYPNNVLSVSKNMNLFQSKFFFKSIFPRWIYFFFKFWTVSSWIKMAFSTPQNIFLDPIYLGLILVGLCDYLKSYCFGVRVGCTLQAIVNWRVYFWGKLSINKSLRSRKVRKMCSFEAVACVHLFLVGLL